MTYLRKALIYLAVAASPLWADIPLTGSFESLTQAKWEEADRHGYVPGLGTITSLGVIVTGVGTDFGNQIVPGMILISGSDRRMVRSISSPVSLVLDTPFTGDLTAPVGYSYGQPMHFAARIDFATGQPADYIDPISRTATGVTAWSRIQQQAAVHGWPLVGTYISSSGRSTRSTAHVVLHRTEFPPQTGGQREDKLQTALDAAMDWIFRNVTTPTTDDPDCIPDGAGGCKEIEFTPLFRCRWHIWNYRQNANLYEPRIPGSGDFAYSFWDGKISVSPLWWQEFN